MTDTNREKMLNIYMNILSHVKISDIQTKENTQYYIWDKTIDMYTDGVEGGEIIKRKIQNTIKLVNEGKENILGMDIETEVFDMV